MKSFKKKKFKDFISSKGLKPTRQRDIILDAFLSTGRHVSANELFLKLRAVHPNIGFATVYRTLKLFAMSGIAREIQFGDVTTRYEHVKEGEHHDHLICTCCGDITEFENERIEELQSQIASTYGFLIEKHNLELYGLCRKCRNNRG